MLEEHYYRTIITEEQVNMKNGSICFTVSFGGCLENVLQLRTVNTQRNLCQFNHRSYGVQAAPSILKQIGDTMITDIVETAA